MDTKHLNKKDKEQEPVAVYFTPLVKGTELSKLVEKTKMFLQTIDLMKIVNADMAVAIKQHFGEKGNSGYIKPEITKIFTDHVKQRMALPLLVETNTLYKGSRSDSYHHLMLAHEHGFSIESVGAPVVILDGVYGQCQYPVSIPGTHFSEVYLVPDLPLFDSIIMLTHVKGHMMSCMGGAIKNLAMGFASRSGKLKQHDDFKPLIDHTVCTRCEMCTNYCPSEAITLESDTIHIDSKKCIGCGECFTACRFGSISFNWDSDLVKFNEKMAEYALGATLCHPNKIVYFNYFNAISKNCDCWGDSNPILYDDVGIFASTDPVAIDKACIDVAEKKFRKNIFRTMWPQLDETIQIGHAEKLGLGTSNYKLIEI